jgi:hypothetical protein
MAVADLAVQQWYGAGPTKATVTTPRLSTMDDDDPGTSNPIPIPSADFNYSYWMSLFLTITNIQDATLLNNHQFYCDGTIGWTLGTDGALLIGVMDSGDNGLPGASYDQATGTEGTTGDYMGDGTDGHAYYKAQTPPAADISDYETGGTELLIDSGDHTVAEAFKGIVIQAKVDDDATRGAMSAETLTFVYDEV